MGGPFRDAPEGVPNVKLAKEIAQIATIHLDIPDFQTPEPYELQRAVRHAMYELLDNHEIYVGCMGGIGRTGMFLGCLMVAIGRFEEARIRRTFWGKVKQFFGLASTPNENTLMIHTPVEYVRAHYIPHAIETQEQEQVVRQFRCPLLTKELVDNFCK